MLPDLEHVLPARQRTCSGQQQRDRSAGRVVQRAALAAGRRSPAEAAAATRPARLQAASRGRHIHRLAPTRMARPGAALGVEAQRVLRGTAPRWSRAGKRPISARARGTCTAPRTLLGVAPFRAACPAAGRLTTPLPHWWRTACRAMASPPASAQKEPRSDSNAGPPARCAANRPGTPRARLVRVDRRKTRRRVDHARETGFGAGSVMDAVVVRAGSRRARRTRPFSRSARPAIAADQRGRPVASSPPACSTWLRFRWRRDWLIAPSTRHSQGAPRRRGVRQATGRTREELVGRAGSSRCRGSRPPAMSTP